MKTYFKTLISISASLIVAACLFDKNREDSREYFIGCWESFAPVTFGNSFIKYNIYPGDSVRYDYFHPNSSDTDLAGNHLNYRWSEAHFTSWSISQDSLWFENGSGEAGTAINGVKTVSDSKTNMLAEFEYNKIDLENLGLKVDSLPYRNFTRCAGN